MGVNTLLAYRQELLTLLGIADDPNLSIVDLELLVFNPDEERLLELLGDGSGSSSSSSSLLNLPVGGTAVGSIPEIFAGPKFVGHGDVDQSNPLLESDIILGSESNVPAHVPTRRSSHVRDTWDTTTKGDMWGGPFSDTTVWAADGLVLFTPVFVSEKQQWNSLNALVEVAGSAGSVLRAWLCADDGHGYPTGSITDLGVHTSAFGGTATWNLAGYVAVPGMYHIGMACQGAVVTRPTVRRLTGYLGNTAAIGLNGPVVTSARNFPFVRSELGQYSDGRPYIFIYGQVLS